MPDDDFLPTDATVDLTNCDREPIHLLGNVQSYGCLLAVSPDWIVQHASTNVAHILGLDPEAMIGTPFVAHFPEEAVHTIRTKMQVLSQDNGAARIFGLDVFGDGRFFDVSINMTGRAFVFEFERKQETGTRDDMALVQPLIARVRRRDDVAGLSREGARGLKALTGFDRVMVYKFGEDQSGTVIAEACEPDMETFLGLRYPASDIPKQARELYKRSLLRLIADVNGEVFPITPERSPEGQPLDLSLAVTRAVSPIHLEYLRNMGVGASMSVSILRKGELWGLFACHHNSPLYVDFEKRTAVELFAQLFAYELADKEGEIERESMERARVLHHKLLSRISSGADLVNGIDTVSEEIADVIPHDGIVVLSEDRFAARGGAPTADEFKGLARFLNTAATSQIFATDRLEDRYPKAEAFGDRVAGLLALPISRAPRDYIVLFRRELAQTVNWAGNPQKPVEYGPNGARLTPRRSFEAWKEVVSGQSAPWTPGERGAAELLRVTLLEVLLKVTDEASLERRRANEQQELLIAELNHRVRNILNLIRGLVSQGKHEQATLDSFTSELDGRIQALARAHDQLTQSDWTSASLKMLVDVEVGAFLNEKRGRVRMTGEDVRLTPEAFSAIALVMHELVTNSAKYGALSDATGSVDLDIDRSQSGALLLRWAENNGPPVKPPSRKGFGTTIIERSIPYDLKGRSELNFKLTGVEAKFEIPARYMIEGGAEAVFMEEESADPTDVSLSGTVLLVEDNLIIAMDASDMLTTLGAENVITASNVADALAAIEKNELSLGVLDVNLGDSTSLEVARILREKGIPYILASGYGAAPEVLAKYPEAPILRKPYVIETLKKVLSALD